MTSTAVLTEDSTTIVAEDSPRFSWGITIAGAVAATATTFFLITLGTGVGLALVQPARPGGAATLLTLGAIWFFASQAFGFAVGGYLVGRLIGPHAENHEEEEFRASAHGFAMWAIAVVASLLLAAASSTLAGSAIAGGAAASHGDTAVSQSYWVDDMFRPAPYSAQVVADKAESARILAMTGTAPLSESDTARIAHLVSQDAGISMQASMNRVMASQSEMRAAADNARKAASILSLWTAFALLFGAVVSVAAAISARWMDDRITFSMAPRPRAR